MKTLYNKSISKVKDWKVKLKDKKGMSTLEFVICLMLFLTVFTFLADLFLILYKQYVVTSAATSISRQIGTQGGIATEMPENYPGNESNYLTYSELNAWIKDLNDAYFLEDDDIYCIITYYADPADPSTAMAVDPKTETAAIYLPYGSYVSVSIYYPIQWTFVSTLSSFNEDTDDFGNSQKSRFCVTKAYVTDYVSWVPEDYTAPGMPVLEGKEMR